MMNFILLTIALSQQPGAATISHPVWVEGEDKEERTVSSASWDEPINPYPDSIRGARIPLDVPTGAAGENGESTEQPIKDPKLVYIDTGSTAALDAMSPTTTEGSLKKLPGLEAAIGDALGTTVAMERDKSECGEHGEAEDAILAAVMENYNKQRLPNRQQGVAAHVEMHVSDISSLSEMEADFTLDLMYSEMWRDERLQYSHLPLGHCVRNITLDLDYLNKLWSPNTCIVNSKVTEIHSSPSPNVFLILYADGSVWKNFRMMVKAPCNIDLRAFPFDSQTCEMVFESYSYNSQKVQLRWFAEAPITLLKKMELADFVLTTWDSEHAEVKYPNGNWDQLKVPTYLTIFVAWINFWMDAKELSTRSTLTISAFLAITLQFGNILKNQVMQYADASFGGQESPVSYIKALDVWMLACIIFLFGALAELAVVSYIMRADRMRQLKENENGALRPPVYANPPIIFSNRDRAALNAYAVDRFMLMAYPPLFMGFNLFYWLYYGPILQD